MAKVKLLSGADVEPRAIEWQWPDWLAKGKMGVMAGKKGDGKSTIGLDLGARMTNDNGKWPDGTPVKHPGHFLVWSSEDAYEDTILPRYMVAGGNRERIHYIAGVFMGDGKERAFDPARDMPDLMKALEDIPDLCGVMIDPIVMAVAGDDHKNNQTRRGLQPLVELAEKRLATVIGITHFTKGTEGKDPVERVTGSLAYGALPRVVLGTAKGQEGSPHRLVRLASNIGPSGGGFEYRLTQDVVPGYGFLAQRVLWGAALQGGAAKLISPEDTSATQDAWKFLTEMLAGGPVPVKELREAALAQGHAWRTIERAKTDHNLQVKAEKTGAHWVWRLMSVEEAIGKAA